MKVLLTNDDGLEAEGLQSVRAALLDEGLEVVVVAPDGNRSGLARACTPGRAVAVRPVPGEAGAFACDGTPVDCVRVALLTRIADDAALVVSGVNHGANLGDDALYSATVGAAVEAALLGRPGLAVSQQPSDGSFRFRDRGPHRFERSARLGARFAAAVAAAPPQGRAVVNLNVPGAADGGSVEVTRLGRRPAGVGRIVLDGGAYHLYGLPSDPAPPHDETSGTDFAALARGVVSATPISLDWDDVEHAERLRVWLEEIAATARPLAREVA